MTIMKQMTIESTKDTNKNIAKLKKEMQSMNIQYRNKWEGLGI